ncbi:MAG TPA: hypothetical protein V6D08_03955 [Candidatus Obscuribacterales bacterium]
MEDGEKYRDLMKEWCEADGHAGTAADRLREEAYFSPRYNRFSPVRPSGLGQLHIGEGTDSDRGNGIDWRKSLTDCDSINETTTFSYYGELEDSGLFSFDTEFSAEETVDKHGRIVESSVVYETPVTQTFSAPDGGDIEIEKITKIETSRGESGNYFTTVTTAGGDTHKFVTSPDGIPEYYEHGYAFRYRRGVAR